MYHTFHPTNPDEILCRTRHMAVCAQLQKDSTNWKESADERNFVFKMNSVVFTGPGCYYTGLYCKYFITTDLHIETLSLFSRWHRRHSSLYAGRRKSGSQRSLLDLHYSVAECTELFASKRLSGCTKRNDLFLHILIRSNTNTCFFHTRTNSSPLSIPDMQRGVRVTKIMNISWR